MKTYINSIIILLIYILILGNAVGQPLPVFVDSTLLAIKSLHSADSLHSTKVSLSSDSLKVFINLASRVNRANYYILLQKIIASKSDTTLINDFFTHYETVKTEDFTKSLVILDLIGHTRNQHAIAGLMEIIKQTLPQVTRFKHGGLNMRDIIEIHAEKAVESLAKINTEESKRLIKEIIKEHPSHAIQATAIDAFLSNRGYSPDSKRELNDYISDLISQERKISRIKELKYLQKLIKRIRLTKSVNSDEFHQDQKEFYAQFPKSHISVKPLPRTQLTQRIKNFKFVFYLSMITIVLIVLILILLIIVIRKLLKRIHP